MLSVLLYAWDSQRKKWHSDVASIPQGHAKVAETTFCLKELRQTYLNTISD